MAHALPGRTRLRLGGPPLAEDQAARLAQALAALPGMREVEINRRTGSVLATHEREVASAEVLTRAGAAIEAEGPPPASEAPPEAKAPGAEGEPPCERVSEIAVEIARLFRGLNHDLCEATDGQLDLGVLATLTFLGAGVAQIASAKQIPPPPWFNLAWWGFRTFMTLEQAAVNGDRDPAPGNGTVKT
jgi:hypothetical protein